MSNVQKRSDFIWNRSPHGDATICRSGEEYAMECLGDEPCTCLTVVVTY